MEKNKKNTFEILNLDTEQKRDDFLKKMFFNFEYPACDNSKIHNTFIDSTTNKN